MKYRYKIRREAEGRGAFVFDRIQRSLFLLPDDKLRILLNTDLQEARIRELPGTLQSFFTSANSTDADQGSIGWNFIVIEPWSTLKGSVNQNYWLAAPNRLYLELTRQCNLRCRLCYNAAGCALPDELTTGQFMALLDQMDEAGVFEVRFTGGEPTLRPDFFEILDYAISKDFYVSLATNGNWSPSVTREICRRRIDDVVISLDGPEEVNDRFRVGGSFKATLDTIRSLKEAGFQKIRINTVLSHENWRNVEPLFQICEDYDLLLIDFIHPRPFGRGATEGARELILSAEETREFNRIVQGLRQKYPGVKVVMDFDLMAETELPRHPIVPRIKACPAGREFAFVSPQGYVFPCGVAPVDDVSSMTREDKELFIAGNIVDERLLEIWHHSPVWEPFRDLRRCKPDKCFSCQFWGKKCFGTCPIGAYYHTGRLDGEDPYCYSHLLV